MLQDVGKRLFPNKKLSMEREKRGWTQQFVADHIGSTKLSVGRWERGETTPRTFYQQRLCELFGLSPIELGLETLHEGEKQREPVPLSIKTASTNPYLLPLLQTLVGREETITKRNLAVHIKISRG